MLLIAAAVAPMLLLVTLLYHLWRESAYKDSRFPEDCFNTIPPTGCEWLGKKGEGEPRIVVQKPDGDGRVLKYTEGAEVDETMINGVLFRTGDILDEDIKGWR